MNVDLDEEQSNKKLLKLIADICKTQISILHNTKIKMKRTQTIRT